MTAPIQIDVAKAYANICDSYAFSFQIEDTVLAYDNTTLFCSAGMQQYKSEFANPHGPEETLANIQPCIRLNDLTLLGDGAHFAYFNMLGLFSFRDLEVKDAVHFWLDFLADIRIKPDFVTVHPDRADWISIYSDAFVSEGIEVRTDDQCKWSDGDIWGYCTEFYVSVARGDGYRNVEIGNIVNPRGTCIDAGFGMERLHIIANDLTPPTEIDSLISCINRIIAAGVVPMAAKHGYELRRLLRRLHKVGGTLDHPFFRAEVARQGRMRDKYDELKTKHLGMSAAWWWDTHGIDLAEMTQPLPS